MPKAKKTQTSEWVKMKPEEVEKIVVDLAKKGMSPEKIGLILRDEHGIPKAKVLGKKIGKILQEHKIANTSEQDNVSKKIETLRKHFGKNKHDYTAQKKIMQYTSRLNKIKAYHAR